MKTDNFSHHSTHLVKKVMECATNAIYAIDLTGKFIMMNEAGARICGRSVRDLVGNPFSILFDEVTLPGVAIAFNKTAFYGEAITDYQARVTQPSGDVKDIRFSIAPLFDSNKIIGVVGTAEDITERLKNEKTLQAYNSTLTTVLEGLDAIVYAADMNTYEIVFANEHLQDFIGSGDLIGRICWQVLQKGQEGPCDFCTNKYLLDEGGIPKKESYSWEFKNTLTDRWLAIKDKAIYWIDGRLVRLEIAIDISEAKKLQERIRSREQKLGSIINTTTEGYWEIDNNNITVEANDALCRMLGYSKEEMLGANVYDFVDETNGAILREQDSLRAVKLHRSFNIALKGRDGREVQTRVHATTLKDNEGNLTGAFAFITDITELLQIEGSITKYAAELERSNKELQDFAYIASHDLQEPLRKIVAFGDRLFDSAADSLDEKGRDYLKRMQSAALRMQAFIEDLLQFSRVMTKHQPFESIDLRVAVQQSIIDLDECFTASKCLLFMDKLPVIEADPLQMRQLFQNLISNAIKFIKPQESPYIKIDCIYPNSENVQIRVQDNGIGFDIKYKDRLFKPFSRLHGKSEYPGTGMGLAICDKIVKRHGGRILVSSESGKGTVFTIEMPLRQKQGGENA